MTDYHVESCPVVNADELSRFWLDLQSRADCSFFQSWGWIEAWLACVVGDIDCLLIKVVSDNVIVGLGIFTQNNLSRRGFITSSAMYLNEAPFDDRNMVIEYNGLLTDRLHKKEVYREVIKYLYATQVNNDEIFFSGVEQSDQQLLAQAADFKCTVLEESLSWSIDLDGFDVGADSYLGTLSKNRRTQIRRSIKIYEESSPLKITEASTLKDSLLFFEGLKQLHTSRWKLKGGRGSFANMRWESFHKTLITACFDKGEVQLLKVSNEEEVIGYLYNFLWRGNVYVLQTGFKMSEDKRLMPGYVVHVLSIAYNKSRNFKVYDLMHGDSLYKKILCKQSKKLYWTVLQRRRIRFMVESATVQVVRGIRKIVRGMPPVVIK